MLVLAQQQRQIRGEDESIQLTIEDFLSDFEQDTGIPEEFRNWVEVEILNDHEEQLSLWDELMLAWNEQAAYLAGVISLLEMDSDIEFNPFDEKLVEALRERSERDAELIQGVTDAGVIMELWDVVYEGSFTIQKASERLQESYLFAPFRAERIARTEILGASRTGQYYSDIQSGLVIGKQWHSALDERTRPGHKAADGQVVPIDKPFIVANASGQMETLMFPGDTSLGASGSNVIMCRCWYKRIMVGEEDKLNDG